MRIIQYSVLIERPAQEVFAFVNDFAAYPQWQTEVVKAEIVSEGPIGVGAWIEETRRFLGREIRLRWQVTEFEVGRKRGFRVTQGPAISEGTMTFEPAGDSTRFSVQVRLQGRGLFRFFEPLLVRALNRQNRVAFGRVKQLLEARPSAQATLSSESGVSFEY